MVEACTSCKFSKRAKSGTLMCRRFPPGYENTFLNGTSCFYPKVDDTDWCGEFVQSSTPKEE